MKTNETVNLTKEEEQIIIDNEYNVRSWARNYAKQAIGCEEDDLYQIGMEAVVKYFHQWDQSKGTFKNYFWWKVMNYCNRFLNEDDGLIHIPSNRRDVSFTYEDIDDEVIQEYISQIEDCSVIKEFDTVLSNVAYSNLIKEVKECLTSREYYVISLRYGLENDEEMILEEVAKLMCVTRERVRQIEARALKKLRWNLRKYYEDYEAFE